MANIMLTYRCNLRCSYCFANEFVNKEKTDFSIKNFLEAVTFITRSGENAIGLIGGEPTLHPGFNVIMEMLIANPNVKSIRLFTNGLILDQFMSQIIHPKVTVHVNCNSPLIIGEQAYTRTLKNLDTMILQYGMKNRVQLGINLFSDDMDYRYIMDLLQRYDMHSLRTSLTVPDFAINRKADVLNDFKKRKQFLLKFYHDMDSIKVMPYSDCNRPPYCVWTDEEKEWLKGFVAKYPGISTNLLHPDSHCIPAIDILPDLQAIRCFGMSDFLKVPISDFKNVADITKFFMDRIDSVACRLPACEECKGCYEQKIGACYAGCLGFKATRIRACNDAIERL